MTKPPTRNRIVRSKSSADIHDQLETPIWLWGNHAVVAALGNSSRPRLRFLATENAIRRLGDSVPSDLTPEIVASKTIDQSLPPGAVHQGVALQTKYLEPDTLEEMILCGDRYVIVLDQLTDPHNLGAILRSAAAFGFSACVMQNRHTPPLNGTVAKAAVGAVDQIREVRVVNIARALNELEKRGYDVVGLAGEADHTIEEAIQRTDKLALVFGAEGSGLRPVVSSACTKLARIPISPEMESLNVSNAAAIAFYEATKSSF